MDETRTLRHSMSAKSFDVTKEQIENADDYGDIFDIADTMKVDLCGLDEIEDMKTRLLLFYKKTEGEPNYKEVIGNSMVANKVESRKKREKLIRLLNETKDKLEPVTIDHSGQKINRRGSAIIKGFLKSEGTIQNLDIDIDNKLEALKSDTCTIVVTGETSAGKSSILNLLFGEEVVPTFFGSCTSVITRISYNRERRAKIIYKNGKKEKIRNIPPKEICQKLKPYLFVEDESERIKKTDIKEVVVQVPAKILECGLVVVDSPGIGENDAMDEVIVNFVNENQINGFMYIIKTDNGGGVDEDRLIGLIKVILEQEKIKAERGLLPFDSKCALFVSNFWDLIADGQQETVISFVNQRIASIWPNMNKSQLMTFSAHKAKIECDIDPDFITDNFREFLGNIKDLHSKAMDKRIISTYKWLETVLKRSVHHLKTIVHRIDNSEEDLETKMRSVWAKLKTLKMKSEVVINDLRKQIEEETDEICDEFRAYLQSPKTRMAVTMWIESELPTIETCKWEDVKEDLQSRTLQKISIELEHWEDENQKIQAVKENVQKSIQFQLNILESELKDIEDDLQADATSIASDDSFESNRHSRRYSVPFENVQVFTGRDTLSVKLVNRMFSPFGKHGRTIIKAVTDTFGRTKLRKYKHDRISYANKTAGKTLDRFISDTAENPLRSVITQFMNEPREFLKDIEKRIPAMVETNQKNMDHISHCRKEGVANREMYEKMMIGMETLKRTVTDYGDGHIFVNDFGVDDIQIIEDDSQGIRESKPFDASIMIDNMESSVHQRNQREIQRSLWSAQQNGILKTRDKKEPVTIRVYLKNARIENTDSEVAKLRLLRNGNVAEFLGIQNSCHPIPAFVFHGSLKTLNRFLNSRLCRVKDDTPRILNEILVGLEYIHRKKMVHMELNQSTIMIDETATVKLCGICQPRTAALPRDKDVVPAGNFVYLSPEVLQGDLYISSADVYAFGLLVFEILIHSAFKDQRMWPLSKFTTELQPNAMNGCPYSLDDVLPVTKEIIQDCLNVVLDKRPSVEGLISSISEIKHEPQLNKKKKPVKRIPSDLSSSRVSFDDSSEGNTILGKRTLPSTKSTENTTTVDQPCRLGGKQLFKTKSDKKKTPHIGALSNHFQNLSSQLEDYAAEQIEPESQSNSRQSRPQPKINILRASSDTPQPTEPVKGHALARLTKSLEKATFETQEVTEGNTSPRRPTSSQLRQS